MIQKQTWKDEIRILITDEENHGSVQISIPLYVSDIFGKADALIYALWVDVFIEEMVLHNACYNSQNNRLS